MTERSLSKRLLPLIDLAERREAEAARELAMKQSQLQAQEQRMKELKGYLHDYAAAAHKATLPALMLNRIAFVDRIDAAMRQQQRVVDQGNVNCTLQRTKYLTANRDTQILERVAAKHRENEEKAAQSREQRMLDDLAARRILSALQGDS